MAVTAPKLLGLQKGYWEVIMQDLRTEAKYVNDPTATKAGELTSCRTYSMGPLGERNIFTKIYHYFFWNLKAARNDWKAVNIMFTHQTELDSYDRKCTRDGKEVGTAPKKISKLLKKLHEIDQERISEATVSLFGRACLGAAALAIPLSRKVAGCIAAVAALTYTFHWALHSRAIERNKQGFQTIDVDAEEILTLLAAYYDENMGFSATSKL